MSKSSSIKRHHTSRKRIILCLKNNEHEYFQLIDDVQSNSFRDDSLLGLSTKTIYLRWMFYVAVFLCLKYMLKYD